MTVPDNSKVFSRRREIRHEGVPSQRFFGAPFEVALKS
jgi:hypothetical protein